MSRAFVALLSPSMSDLERYISDQSLSVSEKAKYVNIPHQDLIYSYLDFQIKPQSILFSLLVSSLATTKHFTLNNLCFS